MIHPKKGFRVNYFTDEPWFATPRSSDGRRRWYAKRGHNPGYATHYTVYLPIVVWNLVREILIDLEHKTDAGYIYPYELIVDLLKDEARRRRKLKRAS